MLAIVGAMGSEIRGLLRKAGAKKVAADHDYHIFRGKCGNKETLIVQSGVGRRRAESVMAYVLGHFPISHIISIGFAGALTEHGKPGDLVACSSVSYADGPASDRKPYRSDPHLFTLAARSRHEGCFCHTGASVTSPQVVSTPEAKRQLGGAFSADIVEMESYWLARLAAENEIPFLTLRVVLDTVDDSLPHLGEMMTGDGEFRSGKAVRFLARHPGQVLTLISLWFKQRTASRRLTEFVSVFIDKLDAAQVPS